jgi:transposase
MKPPIFVKRLSKKQRQQVEKGLRSKDAFEMRRCQIVLASARGEHAAAIAKNLGCAEGTVRNAIKAFNKEGLECLKEKSSRPHTLYVILDEEKREQLRAILHESPRNFGKESSLWTLELAAQVLYERGLTPRKLTIEAIRLALKTSGVSWQRAKNWITSPDPQYALKKSSETV